MKINRKQLRRLIESTIYIKESKKPGKDSISPSSVRSKLNSLNISGLTTLASVEGSGEGLVILLNSRNLNEKVVEKLKNEYGKDKVELIFVAKNKVNIKGGSAGVKMFGKRNVRYDIDKKKLEKKINNPGSKSNASIIFVKLV